MLVFKKNKLAALALGAASALAGGAHAQQVALLDSGVDPAAGFNVVGGFNYFNNTADTSDVSDREGEGHGTVSARLVTESFSGEIVPFVITDGSREQLFEDQVRIARDNALSDILGQDSIRVVGITKASPGVANSSASLIPNLSNARKFIAIMAGNDSSDQPSPLATSSFNLGGVVIVGASDAAGNMFAFSNRAGTTANRFVVANGLPEPGADPSEGGSSFASARIAGIAGAVFQQNPDLTGEQVAQVILESAEDLGDPGTDVVFGRGFIRNAQQVLDNVMGPVVVPTEPTPPPVNTGGGGGGGGGGAGAALLLGGALAGALLLARKPKAKLEKTLVLDSYGRAFELDLNPHISVNDESLHLNQFFHALQQTSASQGLYLPELKTEVALAATTNQDHRFDMIEYFAMPDDRVINDKAANVSLALRSQLSQDVTLVSGYRVSAAQNYGAVSELENHMDYGSSSFISGQAFDSVLSGFSSQAETASLTYAPSDKASLGLGLVSVDQPGRFEQDSFSTILQGGYQFTDNAGLRMQFGQLEEKGSLLGGAAGGIFGVETATTYALNVSGKIQASEKIALVANYGVGKTKVDSADDSLLNGFSNLRSDWYSVGLVGNDVFRASDQFGLALAQPLKVRSGYVNYSLPVGRSADNDILFDREVVNLADTGATERSIEGYYRTKISSKFELGTFFAYRQNPNHFADNGNEALVMATIQYRR